MASFDVHVSPGQGGGYVVDIQADLLRHLNTRVVIPLLPRNDAPEPARTLNPIYEIGGKDHVLTTQFMSAVRAADLGPAIGSLSNQRDEIVRAIDLLLTGV
jgi:toxin CcdB